MDYEKELFAQKTPYLQWLKGRDFVRMYSDGNIGKTVCVFPFSSCMDSVGSVLGDEAGSIKREQNYLFVNVDGKLRKGARELIAQAFLEYPDARVIYADEDYYGTLEELYQIKQEETDARITAEYEKTADGLFRGEPWFKPDFSPDTLEEFFYIGNIFAVRGQELADITGAFGADLSLYVLVKMISHKITAKPDMEHGRNVFVHIPEVLYTNNCLSQRDELAGRMAAKEISVIGGARTGRGRISVIIPSKDNPKVLQRCIKTFVQYAQGVDCELIIVDNGSSDENRMCIEGFLNEAVLKEYCAQYLYQKMEFNFSKMCNLGAEAAKGEFLLFLNDDIEVCSADWLQKMIGYASMEHVGAVGIKLRYPDGKLLQHTGITNMGIGPAHKLCGLSDEGNLYHGHNLCDYDMLAVTAACMLLSREKFERAGGFDEELAVAYNDVELCFRLYRMGLYNVQVNSAFLIHHESLSRGQDTSKEKQARLLRERQSLYGKHPWASPKAQTPDCFYSPNLVQWEKDAAYHVDYQYMYDRIAKPKMLSEKERKALFWQEHLRLFIKKTSSTLEKFYCRLTGRKLHMFTIDSIEEENGSVIITGWHVLRKCDNARLKKSLLLYKDNAAYEAQLYGMLREDVEALFATDAQGTKHTALSGIRLRLDVEELEGGSWQIALVVERGGRKQLVTSSYMLEVC